MESTRPRPLDKSKATTPSPTLTSTSTASLISAQTSLPPSVPLKHFQQQSAPSSISNVNTQSHFLDDALFSTRFSQLTEQRQTLTDKLNRLKSDPSALDVCSSYSHRYQPLSPSSSPSLESGNVNVSINKTSFVPPNLAAQFFQIEYDALFQSDGDMLQQPTLTSQQSLAIANARHNAHLAKIQQHHHHHHHHHHQNQFQPQQKQHDHHKEYARLPLSNDSSLASQVCQLQNSFVTAQNLRQNSTLSPPPSSSTLSSSSTTDSTRSSSNSIPYSTALQTTAEKSVTTTRRSHFQRRTFYALSKTPDERFAPSAPWVPDVHLGTVFPSPSQDERDMYIKYANRYTPNSDHGNNYRNANWVYSIPLTNRGVPTYTQERFNQSKVTLSLRSEATEVDSPSQEQNASAAISSHSLPPPPLPENTHRIGHPQKHFQRRTFYPFRKIPNPQRQPGQNASQPCSISSSDFYPHSKSTAFTNTNGVTPTNGQFGGIGTASTLASIMSSTSSPPHRSMSYNNQRQIQHVNSDITECVAPWIPVQLAQKLNQRLDLKALSNSIDEIIAMETTPRGRFFISDDASKKEDKD